MCVRASLKHSKEPTPCPLLQVLSQIPGYHKNTFHYVCEFLKEMLKFSEHNGLEIKFIGKGVYSDAVSGSSQQDRYLIISTQLSNQIGMPADKVSAHMHIDTMHLQSHSRRGYG